MAQAESAGAVAVLDTELADRELVDSCSWQQILRIFEENVLNSRPSFATINPFNHRFQMYKVRRMLP